MAQGGFPRRTIFNEDMIYAGGLIKNGFAIAYAADARVIHSHNYSGRQQFHRNFDLAVSQAEHPEVFGGLASEGEGIRPGEEDGLPLPADREALADNFPGLAERLLIPGLPPGKGVPESSPLAGAALHHEPGVLGEGRAGSLKGHVKYRRRQPWQKS